MTKETITVKELDELSFDENVRYAEDHEWIETSGETRKVGISDYAQDQMGDIVFVELPEVGVMFPKGAQFGTLESVKAVSELYLPVAGEIVAVNSALSDAPELINQQPYASWIVAIRPDDPSQVDGLMTAEVYRNLLKGS